MVNRPSAKLETKLIKMGKERVSLLNEKNVKET